MGLKSIALLVVPSDAVERSNLGAIPVLQGAIG